MRRCLCGCGESVWGNRPRYTPLCAQRIDRARRRQMKARNQQRRNADLREDGPLIDLPDAEIEARFQQAKAQIDHERRMGMR